MADEVTISFSLGYADSEEADVILALAQKFATVTTKRFIHAKQAIGTSEEAIKLGELASLGWAAFINRDPTNYLELRSATGAGNDIIKIPAGKGCLFYFGSDISAPFAIANTAACQMEYLICEV